MGRPRAFQRLGRDVQAVIDAAPSLAAAARQLGVDRSTLTRWFDSGKATRPGAAAKRPVKRTAPAADPGVSALPRDPDAWATWVRQTYILDPSESAVLDLAAMALQIAHDPDTAAAVKLQAAGRFTALRRELALPQLDEETKSNGIHSTANIRQWPRSAS